MYGNAGTRRIAAARKAAAERRRDSFLIRSSAPGELVITAATPIGLLYGHKIDRRPDEGSGRWHFAIGYTF